MLVGEHRGPGSITADELYIPWVHGLFAVWTHSDLLCYCTISVPPICPRGQYGRWISPKKKRELALSLPSPHFVIEWGALRSHRECEPLYLYDVCFHTLYRTEVAVTMSLVSLLSVNHAVAVGV